MLTPQLVMYEEEVRQIQNVADRLQQDSRSRAILVVDKNGQLIAASGSASDLDTTSLSSLVAGNVAATGGVCRCGFRAFNGREGARRPPSSRSTGVLGSP